MPRKSVSQATRELQGIYEVSLNEQTRFLRPSTMRPYPVLSRAQKTKKQGQRFGGPTCSGIVEKRVRKYHSQK